MEEIVARHVGRDGPLLPILHDIQDEYGHVPAEAVPVIAMALNISRADVHGVISFYHDFKPVAAGKPVVQLCRAEACQARGVDRIAPLFEGDPRIALETVYCLGLCASGPSARIGDEVVARLDERAALRLIERVSA